MKILDPLGSKDYSFYFAERSFDLTFEQPLKVKWDCHNKKVLYCSYFSGGYI